ncbi:MAG: 16S rRNA (cytosine(1402)-N(4))-methyltransferase RsmH [Nitrospinota bacterium]
MLDFKGGVKSRSFIAQSGSHYPVLVDEIVDSFSSCNPKLVVDATVGAGGHAKAILEKIGSVERYIGFDKDQEAARRSLENLSQYKDRVAIINSDFDLIDSELVKLSISKVDALLFDFGISSFQFEEGSRGFSFAMDGPLDMRIDQRATLQAEEIINSSSAKELALIFKRYGEESFATRIAKEIVSKRKVAPIKSTVELASIVHNILGGKVHRKRKIDSATKVFMALRIAVNDELKKISVGLEKGSKLLRSGGLIAAMSFNSLEDRIVKRFFVDNSRKCICARTSPICNCGLPGFLEIINKKPIRASALEIETNNRSRSAKLRVARKI